METVVTKKERFKGEQRTIKWNLEKGDRKPVEQNIKANYINHWRAQKEKKFVNTLNTNKWLKFTYTKIYII